MRIISGTHKGRKINPTHNLRLRPTTDKAKEALFNIIENRYFFSQKNALDLFSGTGNIALEFASRGIEKVIAVDHSNHSIEFISNISKEFKFNISVIHSDAKKYLHSCSEQFNFIFMDPPYNYESYHEIKDIIIKKKLIKKDGLLIIEHDKATIFKDKNTELRRYGTVHFSLFSF